MLFRIKLPLKNCRILMAVPELNRILDRDDVIKLCFVNQIDNRGERRALAAAGWTSDQHDTVLHLDNLAQLLRQTKVFEARRARRNHAHYDRVRSALLENVDTKSVYSGQAKRNVD